MQFYNQFIDQNCMEYVTPSPLKRKKKEKKIKICYIHYINILKLPRTTQIQNVTQDFFLTLICKENHQCLIVIWGSFLPLTKR